MGDWRQLEMDLQHRASNYAVQVELYPLPQERPAEFNGPRVTLDPHHNLEDRCFYLAHALGSICQWSLDHILAQAIFDELHAAKALRDVDPERMERAIREHQAFEQRSSEHAVWLLTDQGHDWAIAEYTLFFRADMASLEVYHRTGTAPIWREFFPKWKERVARGELPVKPFTPRPVPPFKAVRIPKQEVLQEEDGLP